jgi:hypothetical protein
MFQEMLVPMHNCASVQWIMAIPLMKLALNSNRELAFCWPITALNFLLRWERCHFAKPNCLLLSNLASLSMFHNKLVANCNSNGREVTANPDQLPSFQTWCMYNR